MMNRWTFLIFLLVIILIISAFVVFVAGSHQTFEAGPEFENMEINSSCYNIIFGLLVTAFAIPIVAFIMYLFYNGMFSFTMCR